MGTTEANPVSGCFGASSADPPEKQQAHVPTTQSPVLALCHAVPASSLSSIHQRGQSEETHGRRNDSHASPRRDRVEDCDERARDVGSSRSSDVGCAMHETGFAITRPDKRELRAALHRAAPTSTPLLSRSRAPLTCPLPSAPRAQLPTRARRLSIARARPEPRRTPCIRRPTAPRSRTPWWPMLVEAR